MVTKDEKIIKIDGFLRELQPLYQLPRSDGQEKLNDILPRLKYFLKAVYDDGENRYKECSDFNIPSIYADESMRQKIYINNIKKIERNLVAYKEEAEFQTEFSQTSDKLNRLSDEIEEKRLEAARREKVTETKFHGAAIEMIDRLRDEIKDKSKIYQEIIEMKKDIKEIKDILYFEFGTDQKPTFKKNKTSE